MTKQEGQVVGLDSHRFSALFSLAATGSEPFSRWQLWGQLAYFLDVSNVARNALAVPLPGEVIGAIP